MQILIELVILFDCSVIGCTSHELLDKERTFPCARAVAEAMRWNWTRRLRTDFSFHPRKLFQISHTWEWNNRGPEMSILFSFGPGFALPCSSFLCFSSSSSAAFGKKITCKWSKCGLESSLSSNFERHAFPKAPKFCPFQWVCDFWRNPFLWDMRRKEPLFPADTGKFSFHSKCWNGAEYVSSK